VVGCQREYGAWNHGWFRIGDLPTPLSDDQTVIFDSGPLTSDLPLGGSVHIVLRNNGDFTFSSHAHDSGFDSIHYIISAVLMTPSGMVAFTYQHQGMWKVPQLDSPLAHRTATMTSQREE